jgi:hypothetical protein
MFPDEPHWDGDGEGMVDKYKANSRRKPGEREIRKLLRTRTLSLKGDLVWGIFLPFVYGTFGVRAFRFIRSDGERVVLTYIDNQTVSKEIKRDSYET